MERLYRNYFELIKRSDFKRFLNDFSLKLYDVLSIGYANNKNEVALVTDLSNTINNTSFEYLNFHAFKIHGSRSYVEFNHRDEPTTKELADMLIISIASYGRKRVFQKVSFVQNKKESNKKWLIDECQLFLLKNFPTITGKKGLFKNFYSDNKVDFINHSESLGTYGLFSSPGDMIIVSAKYIDALLENNKISLNNLKRLNAQTNSVTNGDLFPSIPHQYFEEIIYMMHKYGRKSGYSYPFNSNLPFLTNSMFSSDISEFVRNWSLFNIGEPTFSFGNIHDEPLDQFINYILRSIGMSEYVDIKASNENHEFDSNMIVTVLNYNIKE